MPLAAHSASDSSNADAVVVHVQSQAGIPHVFGTFQQAFKKQRKGKGHETHDLGCLLDMYERWAWQLFPYCDFDTFITKVANLHGRPGGKASKGATLKVGSIT
jgi:hypothetical protein